MPDEVVQREVVVRAGDTFAERYRIRRLIDRGQSGRVYEAEQMSLRRVVALKILDVASADADALARHADRFLREASQLGRLSSPHTVRVWDHGVHAGTPYIAMEFVQGESLRHILDRERLDPVRAVRIARQICASLGEAHFLGLVHRDLKPANTLVSPGPDGGDHVKVVDFGLVKEVEDAAHMTGDGVMVGTPMYMSPEQIRGGTVDQRSDVYSLGVVLFRMITGKYPFPETQQAQLLMAHLSSPPATFAEVGVQAALPPCVEWTVQSCLHKEPDQRFATADELARALKLCEAALLDPDTARHTELRLDRGRLVLPEALFGTPTPQRRRRAWAGQAQWIAVASALIASAFLVVIWVVVALAPWTEDPAPTPVVTTPAHTEPAVVAPEPPVPAPASVPEVAPVDPVPAAPARPRPRPIPVPVPVPVPEPAPAPVPSRTPQPETTDLVDPWSQR